MNPAGPVADRRPTLAIMGVGSMGGALLAGLLKAGWTPEEITLIESYGPRAAEMRRSSGCRTVADPAQGVDRQEAVVLAVKPQDIAPALEQLAEVMTPDQVLVALAAGVPISVYERFLAGIPVVRTMPNTPALIGEGITACSAGARASDEHMALALAVLSAVGEVEEVDESLLDAVTAVSGSGPAYAYLLAEAMADAGMREGLDPDTALRLAVLTVKGAAAMMEASDEGPAVLRRRVASPGGTTEAALAAMDRLGFTAVVGEAVAAAARRSEELGKAAAGEG